MLALHFLFLLLLLAGGLASGAQAGVATVPANVANAQSAVTPAAPATNSRKPSACPPPHWQIEPLAEGVWWIHAAEPSTPELTASGDTAAPGTSANGDVSPLNRGMTVNLLAARQGQRMWLIGAGPSPAAARALNCQLARSPIAAPLGVTDVINPMPQATFTLGNRGFVGARVWAHEDVQAVMRQRCPQCEAGLRQQLGSAAKDLGIRPILLPTRRFSGDSGQLGPWRWQRLWRGPHSPVTVWRIRLSSATGLAKELTFAPGLLWADGPPDGRDTQWQSLNRVIESLVQAAPPDETGLSLAALWLPTQGPLLTFNGLVVQQIYAQSLLNTVRQTQARGGLETDPPPFWRNILSASATTRIVLDGQTESAQIPSGTSTWREAVSQWRHALNWQRAWRQMEESEEDLK